MRDFSEFRPHPDATQLAAWIADTRSNTAALLGEHDHADWIGPQRPTINPPLWELGHLAWFWEKWLLRGGDTHNNPSALLPNTDALYDSMAVGHATRWHLPLPDVASTWAYLDTVLSEVRERLSRETTASPCGDALAYYTQLCVFHQDMHNEAFAIRRQLLGQPAPALGVGPTRARGDVRDLTYPDGMHMLGAVPGTGFAFDNEKWAHRVASPSFAIASAPVTQGEFGAFVEYGGYSRESYWSCSGWAWLTSVDATAPVYWRGERGHWQARRFDSWHDLESNLPMVHVNAHEAQAYCAWANRRLPSETEWERACPDLQCRGLVWEWTSSVFAPYPGFTVDPYEDYSHPWFDGGHRVLRGGSVASAPRNWWRTWRNFYSPERNDMFCGFRTCAQL